MRVLHVNTKSQLLQHSSFCLNYLILQVHIFLIQYERHRFSARQGQTHNMITLTLKETQVELCQNNNKKIIIYNTKITDLLKQVSSLHEITLKYSLIYETGNDAVVKFDPFNTAQVVQIIQNSQLTFSPSGV